MTAVSTKSSTTSPPLGGEPWESDALALPRAGFGSAPALALAASCGLVVVALANNGAREGAAWAEPLFWLALAAIFAPIAWRLLSHAPSRRERIALVLVLGVSLYFVKVLAGPIAFVRYDELGTWRATSDLLQSGRLFTDNPLVVTTAAFPGLPALTGALAGLAGISVFHAGLIVIGIARAALIVGLFLFFERITRSTRAAGIGVAAYACNPSFLYFDSQFGYESLALALAAALLVASLEWAERRGRREPAPACGFVIVLLVAGLMATHHMTSVAMFAFFAAWATIAALDARPWIYRPLGQAAVARAFGRAWLGSGAALPALSLGIVLTLWLAFVAGAVTVDELGSVVREATDSVVGLVVGDSAPKELFQGGGEANAVPLRALAPISVIALSIAVAAGIRREWRRSESSPVRRTLTLVALLYPITLALRLTLAGSEISQRASEFAFVGVAFLVAIVLESWRPSFAAMRPLAAKGALAALATAVFAGGFVIGELPATRQPGPFAVGADARSLSPEGESAARFASRRLPAERRWIADRSTAMLLGSYGDQDPVFGWIHGLPVPRVLFGERFDRRNRIIVRDQLIDYIAVDRRLSRELPAIGFYVEIDEPGAYAREEPIPGRALAKFDGAPGLARIFDNGTIQVYDASRVEVR